VPVTPKLATPARPLEDKLETVAAPVTFKVLLSDAIPFTYKLLPTYVLSEPVLPKNIEFDDKFSVAPAFAPIQVKKSYEVAFGGPDPDPI
jgi:hypothetical protein